MAARLFRIAGERLAGKLRALLEAAVLAGNQRQIIKRVRIGRIRLDGALEERLGTGRVALVPELNPLVVEDGRAGRWFR